MTEKGLIRLVAPYGSMGLISSGFGRKGYLRRRFRGKSVESGPGQGV